MKYCQRCLYPENHPLGITFDEQGICSGCRVHEEKDVLDWSRRHEKLLKILESFRSKSGRSYDCIIPVSGARDSYFIVHTVKNVFKMHPLLVTYNKHYNTRMGIRNLAYLRTLFGCDIVTLTVSPETVKKITRYTIKKLASIYWHCLSGQTVFPVQAAVRFKIPLIIWGAHQGVDQVGMFSHLDEVEMTRKYRKNHDLMGLEAEDLIEQSEGINEDDIKSFKYPYDKELETVGVRGIYLNNYIRWDTKAQHEQMIRRYKYETSQQLRTFDAYNDVDCFHYSDLHDYIKMIKFGYGKVVDHACREIRLKRITREQGIELARKYLHRPPSDQGISLFLDWVEMDKKTFFEHIENKRNRSVWNVNGSGEWVLSDPIENHIHDTGVEKARLHAKEDCKFTISQPKEQVADNRYILIGRGWVDQS